MVLPPAALVGVFAKHFLHPIIKTNRSGQCTTPRTFNRSPNERFEASGGAASASINSRHCALRPPSCSCTSPCTHHTPHPTPHLSRHLLERVYVRIDASSLRISCFRCVLVHNNTCWCIVTVVLLSNSIVYFFRHHKPSASQIRLRGVISCRVLLLPFSRFPPSPSLRTVLQLVPGIIAFVLRLSLPAHPSK